MTNVSQAVQIEVKYSEAFINLNEPFADGPLHVRYQSRQRLPRGDIQRDCPSTHHRAANPGWPAVADHPVAHIRERHFLVDRICATVDTTEVADLPGSFESSDEKFNAIWKLGAVSTSTACVEKGTQGQIRQVDADKGAFMQSVKPSMSLEGAGFSDYKLEFDTLIDRAGMWWTMVRTNLCCLYSTDSDMNR